MCYQESRFHAICSHTIHARVECPKRCMQYSAIDKVEMQLPAYCHACRRHVDSQGVTSRYRNSYSRRRSSSSNNFAPNYNSRRISSNLPQDASARALAGSISLESLRMTAVSPPPATPLPNPPRGPLPPWAMANGDLRRSLSDRTRKASMGAIMKDFAREQEERDEESRPKMLSPIPQKPVLNLRIPEETTVSLPTNTKSDTVMSTPQTGQASPVYSSDGTETTEHQQAGSNTPTTTKHSIPAARKLSAATTLVTRSNATSPTTPRTPTSLTASLEEPPSKPPNAPLPQLPPLDPVGPLSLIDIRRSLRRTSSSSKLLGSAAAMSNKQFYPVNNGTVNEATPNSPLKQQQRPQLSPIPLPDKKMLRKSKSSRTLAEELAAAHRAAAKPVDLRTGPLSPVPPTLPEVRKRIDIHDPQWLAKHGLKWDAHGLGVVSAAV